MGVILGYTEQCVFIYFSLAALGVCHRVCRLLIAEQGLSSCGSWASLVAVCGLSCPAACGILVP